MGKTEQPNQSKKSKVSKETWSSKNVDSTLYKIRSEALQKDMKWQNEKQDKINSRRGQNGWFRWRKCSK